MQISQPKQSPVIASARFGRGTGLVVVAAALIACGEIPLRESQIDESLPAATAWIVPGQTNRAAVRQRLGAPWLASDDWQFDLFRMSDQDARVLLMLVVPIGTSRDDVRGYVLVSYDESGHVAAYDSGVTHGENLSARMPIEGEDSLLLMVGDLGFAVESSSHTPSVLIPAARRDEYLRTLESGEDCTVLVGCMQDQCSSALVVDGGEARALPGALLRIRRKPAGDIEVLTQSWLAPLTLLPGRHRLEIPPNALTTLEASAEFGCAAGDIVYAAIEIEPGDTSQAWKHWKTQLAGSIAVSAQMPGPFREQPMLIWRDGQWLAPQASYDGAYMKRPEKP
jgi:hypothetical protein